MACCHGGSRFGEKNKSKAFDTRVLSFVHGSGAFGLGLTIQYPLLVANATRSANSDDLGFQALNLVRYRHNRSDGFRQQRTIRRHG